jgi:hypothetical protein
MPQVSCQHPYSESLSADIGEQVKGSSSLDA